MLKLRESILTKIHTKSIRPRPRWQYVLLHAGLWSTGVITVMLGSLACASMLLEFSLPERAYLRWMEMQDDNGLILTLPYFWLGGMIFVLIIGYFIFSKTGRGYRYRASLIASVLLGGSFLGGEILFTTHTIHWGDQEIQRFAPGYRNFRQGFAHMMPRPEDGILPIRVTKIQGKTIIGQTPNGDEWHVNLICREEDCSQKVKVIVLDRPVIFQGNLVKPGFFDADAISFPHRGMHPKMHKKIRGELGLLSPSDDNSQKK